MTLCLCMRLLNRHVFTGNFQLFRLSYVRVSLSRQPLVVAPFTNAYAHLFFPLPLAHLFLLEDTCLLQIKTSSTQLLVLTTARHMANDLGACALDRA
jgi:hypothetical protein